MGILKGFALSILSLLLFLSLVVFGFAYTVNSTVLNPKFVSAQIDRLDVSAVIQEIVTEQTAEEDFPEELMEALVDTIDKLEAPVKQQVSVAVHETYDYLLGKKTKPDLATTLGTTFFHSDFVASLMAELDLAALAEDIIIEQFSEEGFTEELGDAIVSTISKHESTIKQKVVTASEPVFDYLLGKTSSINLSLLLRATLLTPDFVSSLLEELDIDTLSSQFLTEKIEEQIPEELQYLSEYVDDAVTALVPLIKEEIINSVDPILGYLLGERQSVSVTISLDSVIESLEDDLREAFLKSPPPEYSGLPQNELNQLFDVHFAEVTSNMGATIEIDEALFPAEIPTQIASSLDEAERGLEQARQDLAEAIAEAEVQLEQVREYVSQFQTYYYLLIGLLALLVLAIILINLEVKGACRWLGITFLVYGVIFAAGVFFGKDILHTKILQPALEADLPLVLQNWILQMTLELVSPLQIFSIGIAVFGVVLLVVSFVYPRLRQTSPLD